ncbi:hypothetical protein BsWGS_27156 [Bradybaena similaris]
MYLLSDSESDYCYMRYYTHDLKLAQRLEQTCQEKEKLRCNIRDKLQETTNFKRRQPTLDKQPLLFIVSHPHGCSKQISIGHWTSAREHFSSRIRFTYTTATCPGSSGASIYLPQSFEAIRTLKLFSYFPIHIGEHDKQRGINYSNIHTGYCTLSGCGKELCRFRADCSWKEVG